MRFMLRLVFALIITTFLGFAVFYTWKAWEQANRLVFVDGRPISETPEAYQDVEILLADGTILNAWFRAPTRADGASLLFLHGHGGNRRTFSSWAQIFKNEGYGILLLDFRPMTGDASRIATLGVNEADSTVAAFHFLQMQEGVNPERIAIVGHSMGGASAILAAAQIPDVRLVVAMSSYSSARDLMLYSADQRAYPTFFYADLVIAMSSYLSGADYSQANPLAVVSEIEQPSLFIAGSLDTAVPPSHSQLLYNAANEPKELYFVEGADHNALFNSHRQEFLSLVSSFFEQYLINE